MHIHGRPRSRDEFEIAVICALRIESDAVEALFDEFWEEDDTYGKAPGDPNAYTTGRIGAHDVVLAFMPGMGKGSAAGVAASFRSSFPHIKLGLVVGICGGVPMGINAKEEIILGDVIVSTGLVQFDFGRQYSDKVVRKDTLEDNLGRPNNEIRAFLKKMEGLQGQKQLKDDTLTYLAAILAQEDFENYKYPGPEEDKLYKANYRHKHYDQITCSICALCTDTLDPICDVALESSCVDLKCNDNQQINRDRVQKAKQAAVVHKPLVHFGRIASGDLVMKSGHHRDDIAAREKVIAFEMEGAGVWDNFPTVVIKGVCDYADSHKNKKWQNYAAATAAACTKAFLKRWRVADKLSRPRANHMNATSEGVSSLPSTYFIVSRERVEHFVGREDQLRDITAYFSESQVARPRTLILYALGGQGKSQIALEYCRSTKKIYRGVFWINANSESTAVRSYHQIAAALTESSITSLNDDNATIGVVKSQLQSWSERWLLVLDNFDQPEIFDSVRKFIPTGGRGDILFTSRHRGLDRLGKIYEIPPMSTKEGVSLLLGLKFEDDVQQHMDAASKVVDRLGGLPLAMDQAAAYIKYKQIPPDRLDDFLVTYEAQRRKVLEHTPRQFWEYGTMQNHGEARKNQAISAFTTWEMSFEQLQANDERSRSDISHFLTLSAFFDLTHIGESLFRHYWEAEDARPVWMDQFTEAGDPDSDDEASSDHEDHGGRWREIWSSERFWELVAKLHELSLLQSISTGNRRSEAWFSLHPLIRDWLQLREPMRQRREYVREGINMVVNCIKVYETHPTPSSEKAILVAHIDMCLLNDARFSKSGSMLGQDITSCNTGECISCFYHSHGRYNTSERLERIILKTKTTNLGMQHPDTLMSMSNLASMLSDQGKYEQAEEMHRQALRLRETVLGTEHPETLASMNNLALTLSDQGKYEQGEEMHRQALGLRETELGTEHPDTLASMNNLALVLSHQGKYEQAQEMHQQALRLSEMVLGTEHPNTLASMSNLALTLSDQGKYEQGEEMHRQALRLRETVLGKEHPDTLTSMNNLASMLSDQGKYEQGEEMHRQALKLRETLLGTEHPDTLASMNNLASVLSDQGKYEQGEEMHRQALRLKKVVLGKEHPSTLGSINNLASVLSRQGKYKQAEEMHRQALRLSETVLGTDHPDTLASMNNLASVLSRQGKYEQAEEMHRQALGLKKVVLGKEHPSTLGSMNNLASVLSDQGKYEQAEEMHRQALGLKKAVLGKDHPSTLASMNNLASVLSCQGKYEQAEEMHRQALKLKKVVLGKEHPSTLGSMNNLASVLSRQGKYEQAEEMHRQALRLRETELGTEHPKH